MTDILLPKAVVHSLRKYLDENRTGNEHGGILLGLRKESALQVVSATLPQKWDYATPISFKRSARGHAGIATKEWLKSGHEVDWLGEWHSHPPGHPNPSTIDRLSWKRISRQTQKTMLFVIFSGADMYVGIQKPQFPAVIQGQEYERSPEFHLYGC